MASLSSLHGVSALPALTPRTRFQFALALLVPLLVVSITVAVVIGPVSIPPLTVWKLAFAQLTQTTGDWTQAQANIVWLIRFPRVLMAGVVGGSLAVIGVVMQAMTRNPLADPFLLGVSSGAAFGAVSVLLLGAFAAFGIYALSVGAFVGALVAFMLVFALASQRGRLMPTRMILAGVAVSFVFSALTSFLSLHGDDSGGTARRVLFWMLGGLSGTQREDLALPALILLIGMGTLLTQARALNALSVGDETAITLGVDVHVLRRRLLIATSLLTGVVIAVSGTIGFVGLMMPHIVRLLVGSGLRRVLVVSLLAGAAYLIWMDVFARTLFAPEEIPVGILTSICGAPFFLWLMFRSREEA